jgi:hypothetical protein
MLDDERGTEDVEKGAVLRTKAANLAIATKSDAPLRS